MDTLSFDLIRLIASYLSYSEVVNLLNTNKYLHSQLNSEFFWRCYVHSQCPSFFTSSGFKQKQMGWREMCAVDVYRSRVTVYVSGNKQRFRYILPIVYQEDLLMKSITGEVYLSGGSQLIALDMKLDKLISSHFKDNTVQLLYLDKGQVWLYQAMGTRQYRDYYLIEGSSPSDVTNASSVYIKGGERLVVVRGQEISYISITSPKPCEADTTPRVTEIALDIKVPGTITSVAITVSRPDSERKKNPVNIFIVTSNYWLYHYYHTEGETLLISKRPNILVVVNYGLKAVILDERGNISRITESEYETDGTCQYVLRNNQYYIKHCDRDNKVYTLRNYISYRIHHSYQVMLSTTLAKLESYRRRIEMKK